MLERINKICTQNKSSLDFKSELDKFIEWMESKQEMKTVRDLNYHKYFKPFHRYLHITYAKGIFFLKHFSPEEIDDGKFFIYKSLVLVLDIDLEDGKLLCYDKNKKELAVEQEHTRLNKNIVITYDDIKDPAIAFFKVKLCDKETDFINVQEIVATACKKRKKSSINNKL
ncbi:hypothetical protein NGRA_0723 [Nosema granulosis]|uniref:Uncharacterized protein n=1 Tax=Nosema granulosis TaxID=83296 RepID=A0A9P6GZU6_9MICR|nr:hypothetical protein NGRA_0723 [Nosema granulosis]